MTIEELIRDRAAKGELTHLSLTCSAIDHKWAATYAPAHTLGCSVAMSDDPVEAIVEALTAVKSSKKSVTAAVTKTKKPRMTSGDPVSAVTKSGKLDDWMTKI